MKNKNRNSKRELTDLKYLNEEVVEQYSKQNKANAELRMIDLESIKLNNKIGCVTANITESNP